MSFNTFGPPPSMPDAGASEAAVAGTVAFLMLVILSALGWGVWMAYRTGRQRTTRPKTPVLITKPDPFYASETNSLEMGKSFAKSNSYSWAPKMFSSLRSHDSGLSTYSLTPPEPAFVSGWVPFPPPGLPPCQTLNIARVPLMVDNSGGNLPGMEAVLGRTVEHHPHQARPLTAQAPLTPPKYRRNLSEQPDNISRPRIGLGLSLSDIAAPNTVDHSNSAEGTHSTNAWQRAMSMAEGCFKNETPDNTTSPSIPNACQLPTPLTTPVPTPTLPKLVLTSASFIHNPVTEINRSCTVSRMPAAPTTPSLVLTSPSIHCGLGLTVDGHVDQGGDEELENWSDILALDEYEEEIPLLNEASASLLDNFPTPPETPKCLSSSTADQLPSIGQGRRALYVNDNDTASYDKPAAQGVGGESDDTPFDYAAFRERLAVFLRDVQEQKRVASELAIEDTARNAPVVDDTLPSSCGTELNYGKLLARKRSVSIISNPPARARRELPQRFAPRPHPVPADLQLLLDRGTERPKLRPRV